MFTLSIWRKMTVGWPNIHLLVDIVVAGKKQHIVHTGVIKLPPYKFMVILSVLP